MTDHERTEPTADPTRTEDLDPGAFTGNRPERAAETIPGGIGPKDERIAAYGTRSGEVTGQRTPEGHREGAPADDAAVREAGQDR
jgi:hypothetical protein